MGSVTISRGAFTCVICLSVISTWALCFLTMSIYPLDLSIVMKHKSFTEPNLTRRLSFFDRTHRISDIKQALETEFNKHIDLVKVLQLRANITDRRLSSNMTILIPPHQQDGGRVKFYRYKNMKTPPKGLQFIPQQRTCAVIGNSGILLNSKCGAEIDAHDFVLRSNMAPRENYTDDVGNQTDVMTVNSMATKIALKCIMDNTSSCYSKYLDIYRYLNGSILWFAKFGVSAKSHLQFVSFFMKHNLNILIAHPPRSLKGMIASMWDMLEQRYSPSSGLFLYTVTVSICDKISLYGFYPFNTAPDGRELPYHYYDRYTTFKSGHNMSHEFHKLVSLSKQGYFRMVTDECVV
ncbi:alpha-2,8-sialyltransferase 8B-like [Anneissia japonica]|uniref:alpha-2,8-sialyltransferase 8B-like n=1 Tax=Anneissia japonica TaxID=1529436 RepID=UPI00142561AF|nr:alpha-2,8-sialyltransferase 8B-like [Anneissia japonica]XP_033114089.1 alpha-2,8-sialyltransferase 8B-like [Anneissia japonica]XP_033114090.1 alpha-2,8-sialyltransferase 8B-like [Anneissia japonica]